MKIFDSVQITRPKYSTFDLSYDHKLSFKMGKIIPCHIQEALPGDKMSISQEAMFRMMPMIAPIMHKVDIHFHNFFVPNRILWPGFEEFITGNENFAFPVIDYGTEVEASSLGNYLGLPIGETVQGKLINALPFAAYHRIYHEFYRDQNLQMSDPISLINGVQSDSIRDELKILRTRAWEHDYFTACLPWAQKGDAVDIPLDFSSISIVGVQPGTDGAGQPIERVSADGSPAAGSLNNTRRNTDNLGQITVDNNAAQYKTYLDPQNSLQLDGTGGATVNDLRKAFALQKWLEKNARAGTRFIESLLANFGKRSSDARLQRPQYLGGSKGTMAISEVLQTSSSDLVTPQGNMSGHGIAVSQGKFATYECEEWGYFMTMVSIRPKTAYYNGLPRHFWKSDRLDFAWPDFAHLGEQEVKKGELVLTGDDEVDNKTFGYIPQYSEYRYNPARVSGELAASLEFWHMGRKFPQLVEPMLNSAFISCDPTKRIFAVEDPEADEIVAHIYHKIIARRPLPMYGTPGGL